VKVPEQTLEETIVRLILDQGAEGSVCPSEVARDIAARQGGDWRTLLSPVREAAVRMATANKISILRNGETADPKTFRGIYRLTVSRMPPPRVVLTVEDLLEDKPDTEERPPLYLPPINFDDDPEFEEMPEELPPAAEYNIPARDENEDDDPDFDRPPETAQLEDIAGILRGYLGDAAVPAAEEDSYIEIADDPIPVDATVDIAAEMTDEITELQSDLWAVAMPGAMDDFDREALESISHKLGSIAKQLRNGALIPPERRYLEITRLVEEIAPGVLTPDLGNRLIDLEHRYRVLDTVSEDDLAAEFDHAPRRDAEIVDDVVGLPREQDVEPVLPHGHEAFWGDFQRPPSDEK
jgi:hypothetical protein